MLTSMYVVPVLPQQPLEDGKEVRFGQPLAQVSALVGKAAVDDPSPIARRGTDKKIILKGVTLSFDSDRLNEIEFTDTYSFKNPPTPYKEIWKNFGPIQETTIRRHMTRRDFLAYLALWEDRAKTSGAKRTESDDPAVGQYRIDYTTNSVVDMISISLGPSRSTGKGGFWSDAWTICFTTEFDRKLTGTKVGILTSLSALSDKFNTHARPISDGDRGESVRPQTNSSSRLVGSHR
jgi:hypothetical protein